LTPVANGGPLLQSAPQAALAIGFRIPRLSRRWHPAVGVGQSEDFAMTCKIIAFEFVVPTAMATALAIMLSIVAVYLTDKYLGPIEQAGAHGLL
jgi:hypothetical protein